MNLTSAGGNRTLLHNVSLLTKDCKEFNLEIDEN